MEKPLRPADGDKTSVEKIPDYGMAGLVPGLVDDGRGEIADTVHQTLEVDHELEDAFTGCHEQLDVEAQLLKDADLWKQEHPTVKKWIVESEVGKKALEAVKRSNMSRNEKIVYAHKLEIQALHSIAKMLGNRVIKILNPMNGHTGISKKDLTEVYCDAFNRGEYFQKFNVNIDTYHGHAQGGGYGYVKDEVLSPFDMLKNRLPRYQRAGAGEKRKDKMAQWMQLTVSTLEKIQELEKRPTTQEQGNQKRAA